MRLHSSIRSYSAYHSNNKRTPLSFLAGCSLHNNANHINSITSPRIHLSGRRSVVAFHSTVVPIDNKSLPSDDDSPDTSTTTTTGSHQKLPQWKDMGRGGDSSRSYTKYEQLVRRLYMTNLFHPVKLGLQNINRLHELLGCPMDNERVKVIHVAGTNGKGSVSLKIARSIELSSPNNNGDIKVGLFVSPHISSFRERMSVNGVPITEQEVEEYMPRIFHLCEEFDIPATFFEITAALAFLYYKEKGVNYVVLETGLGGRLDATNILKQPALCVITSIGLEHTRILGETIPEIAREKGGIMKSGCPVLVGPSCPHDVLRQQSVELNVSEYLTPSDIIDNIPSAEEENSNVDYDVENSHIAAAAVKIVASTSPSLKELLTDEIIQKGTSERPPCRFEELSIQNVVTTNNVKLQVILDVAHNPPAMKYLIQKLRATYPGKRYRFVVGMSADKDLGLCGRMLLDAVASGGGGPSSLHLVEATHPRAATLQAMMDAVPKLQDAHHGETISVGDQVRHALLLAAGASSAAAAGQEEEIVIVCGSVFLMADARAALGYDEPRDSNVINEVAGCNLLSGQENFGNTDPEKVLMERAARLYKQSPTTSPPADK